MNKWTDYWDVFYDRRALSVGKFSPKQREKAVEILSAIGTEKDHTYLIDHEAMIIMGWCDGTVYAVSDTNIPDAFATINDEGFLVDYYYCDICLEWMPLSDYLKHECWDETTSESDVAEELEKKEYLEDILDGREYSILEPPYTTDTHWKDDD